jgi:hypothetical protein
MSSTGTTIDQMLSAVQAAGECLNVLAAPFASRWRVRLADGQELHFSETTGNRLLLRKLIDRHPAEKPGSLAPTIRHVPVDRAAAIGAANDGERIAIRAQHLAAKGAVKVALRTEIEALHPETRNGGDRRSSDCQLGELKSERFTADTAREARKEEIKATASQIFKRRMEPGWQVRPPFKPGPKPPKKQNDHLWETNPPPHNIFRIQFRRSDRPATHVSQRRDLLAELERDYRCLLAIGSAWETVSSDIRHAALERAHEIYELVGRNVSQVQKACDETCQLHRRDLLRHPGVDLNALGVPDPIPTVGRAAE